MTYCSRPVFIDVEILFYVCLTGLNIMFMLTKDQLWHFLALKITFMLWLQIVSGGKTNLLV